MKKYSVYILSEIDEWLDWVKMGEADTLHEAKILGKSNQHSVFWGIRLSSDLKPHYLDTDDGKWIK